MSLTRPAFAMPQLIPCRRPDPATQPRHLYEPYRSTVRRAPAQSLIVLPHTLTARSGPLYDLTRQDAGEPLGERIIVAGRVTGEDGPPAAHSLIEQAARRTVAEGRKLTEALGEMLSPDALRDLDSPEAYLGVAEARSP